jgi:hypothetical protein
MVSFMPRDALPLGDEVHVTVYHVDDIQAVHIWVDETGVSTYSSLIIT